MKPLIKLIKESKVDFEEEVAKPTQISPSEFVRNKCKDLLKDLNEKHNVNSDKWIDFIDKVIKLSKKV